MVIGVLGIRETVWLFVNWMGVSCCPDPPVHDSCASECCQVWYLHLNFGNQKKAAAAIRLSSDPKIPKTKSNPKSLSSNPSKHTQFHTYSTVNG